MLDIEALTPLTPEVISRQATIIIGTIGQATHGNLTLVRALSGVDTHRFSSEHTRHLTIKLGYAGAKIYKSVPRSPKNALSGDEEERPMYASLRKTTPDRFTDENGVTWALERHVSFIDSFDHEFLMRCMLNGTVAMDAALLVIAGNDACPPPQTAVHLAAIEIMGVKNVIIVHNKADLLTTDEAMAHHDQIKQFVQGTVAANAPIISISAFQRQDIDLVCEHVVRSIPIPLRDFTSHPKLVIIRSFNGNKPGEGVEKLQGGVAGGSLLQGVLRLGDEIEIRPGIFSRNEDGKVISHTPIVTRIVSLKSDENNLDYAVPGGLIGVGTLMDPSLTRSDRLVGHVLGLKGSLPDVFTRLEVNFFLLRRVLGLRRPDGSKGARIEKLAKGEMLMIHISAATCGGKILAVKSDAAKILVSQPVCTQEGDKIALSRRIEKRWRLIGWGEIRRGIKSDDSS
ncbi:unnamed protein product [Aphanomyces euteiches]|uniref:protein-synthesizing GTPase n=1 Tax=Aphanomyces euteiches TaxID=100861 RepID=A0A6G0XX40_9STRA|nr:hypothetical protein Ae201684_000328 [Aphanomyces euteiches]KAH9091539.1 hypothetical protein Ae201684P_011084 [Aphanomyces euteiches]KAH9139981.1 hypothetical protein AeRB84_015756 [Aphanomyces euteiches]